MWIFSYDLHLIWLILGFFTLFMIFTSGLIDQFEDKLPLFIIEAFRYGKTLNGPVQTKIISLIQVPKSWFTHFYIFSSIYTPFLLFLAIRTYMLNEPVHEPVRQALDFLCTESRESRTDKESVLLVLTLLCLQCFRRLYECVFVNSKSNSLMNVLHYTVGFAHYFCAGTGVLCEAPQFANSGSSSLLNLGVLWTPINLFLILVFLWAWYFQLRTHLIFSELKKKTKGGHGIPEGSLFSLVSCPHYLCEIIIYTVFMLLLGPRHQTMLFVCCWVWVNQILAALMSHTWYKNKFKEYPSNRRAIFPYIL
ncbi:polyprenol reductase [Eurytemora carolleeae]|uniref:polyprenol reductase n=1 Tax=Eurytemora carolleeae TaxID=1294199 RepID=UPI000C78515C|nr:polyprenol reductase [Eurytemora carolleeae]|eukprot:XP_023338447.1 polyprenol reductase-like [Eurytemora affinis]